MTAMLASVRTLDEALLALRLGADLIDLKEPSRGALGALDHAAVRVMVKAVARRSPVSATIGDIPEMDPDQMLAAVERLATTGVDFVKIGFFVHERVFECARAFCPLAGRARLVAVIFADEPWQFSPSLSGRAARVRDGDLAPSSRQRRAREVKSPSPSGRGAGVRADDIPSPFGRGEGVRADLFVVLDNLAQAGFTGAMLDTAQKNGRTLRDWCSQAQLNSFVQHARSLGLLSGLAGSLTREDISALLAIAPDYLGFRGALCRSGERVQTLDENAFSRIRREIRGGARSSAALSLSAA